MSTDKGKPMPRSRIIKNCPTPICKFCKGPNHYGWCDDMRLAWELAVEEGRGRPVPNTR